MEVTKVKTTIVSLSQLKDNLRLTSDDFNSDLTIKLNAAIQSASSFIGRDLSMVDAYAFRWESETILDIDPAKHISSVKVNGTAVQPSAWSLDGNVFKVAGQEDDVVEVMTAYNDDIQAAIMMHASSLWRNPTDTVETLTKASTNLLRQYRNYASRY